MAETAYFELFPDHAGETRWHRQAANNRITADSGEGYSDPSDAVKEVFELRHDEPVYLLDVDGNRIAELRPPE